MLGYMLFWSRACRGKCFSHPHRATAAPPNSPVYSVSTNTSLECSPALCCTSGHSQGGEVSPVSERAELCRRKHRRRHLSTLSTFSPPVGRPRNLSLLDFELRLEGPLPMSAPGAR